jgi:hypothetical protein
MSNISLQPTGLSGKQFAGEKSKMLATERGVRTRMSTATPTLHGPNGLSGFANECAEALFANVQYRCLFPNGITVQNWPAAEIKKLNEEFLASLRHRANLYCIFVRAPGPDSPWKPFYVGERKSTGLRERVTQHFIEKHHKTGSMLEAIKTAVASGQEIGFSFVKVQPDSLRLFVEETIIAEWKKKGELPWNSHG